MSRLANDFFDYFEDEKDRRRFRGVKDKEIHIVEDLAGCNIVVYSCDRDDKGHLVGMVSRRSLNKYPETVHLLRYDKHVCYIRDPEAVFKKYRCPNCDTFFRKPYYLERHLTSCDERVKHLYPGGVYFIKKTIFDELEEIGIVVPPENRLFKHLAIFDFESICKPRDENDSTLRDTATTTWVGRHVPISVSISSNLLQGKIFLCDPDPSRLVRLFCEELKKLQERSATIMSNMNQYSNN